ncbi:hypothetical protein PR048_031587 [Dryococelus australis]|uniref:Uncharacterized protein n=1 Tax=Dryococelus australis TaxID=614101 RepID=A0ABQ9G6D9_9NEOP|nr:hypothetical protein PR048_031587 [Dryococelus australis]
MNIDHREVHASRDALEDTTGPSELARLAGGPCITSNAESSLSTCHSGGATVAERLDCSPPSKANRVQSPAGSLRIFASGNPVGRCLWSAVFLGDIPFPKSLHPDATPCSHLTPPSSVLKTSMLRAAQISSLTLSLPRCQMFSVMLLPCVKARLLSREARGDLQRRTLNKIIRTSTLPSMSGLNFWGCHRKNVLIIVSASLQRDSRQRSDETGERPAVVKSADCEHRYSEGWNWRAEALHWRRRHLELFFAFNVDKGYTATCIKCAVAATCRAKCSVIVALRTKNFCERVEDESKAARSSQSDITPVSRALCSQSENGYGNIKGNAIAFHPACLTLGVLAPRMNGPLKRKWKDRTHLCSTVPRLMIFYLKGQGREGGGGERGEFPLHLGARVLPRNGETSSWAVIRKISLRGEPGRDRRAQRQSMVRALGPLDLTPPLGSNCGRSKEDGGRGIKPQRLAASNLVPLAVPCPSGTQT